MAETVKQIFHIEVDGEGKIKSYTNSLKDNKKQTDDNNKSNKNLGAGLAKTALAWGTVVVAVRKATQFLKESVRLTNEQITADTRLTTIMRTVTGARDDQIRGVMQLADEYQRLTTVGDEVIQMGQSQLASFGFNAEATEELTGSLLDLAVATYGANVNGDQLIQTANMLGKAYTGLPGMLSRAGVLLSDQQSEMIKTGSEADRLATLIEVVEQNYGGLAEAMAQTPEGKILQLKNEFEDFREEIGARVLPIMGEIAGGFSDMATSMEEAGAKADSLETLSIVIKSLASVAVGAVGAIDIAFSKTATDLVMIATVSTRAVAEMIRAFSKLPEFWSKFDLLPDSIQEKQAQLAESTRGFADSVGQLSNALLDEAVEGYGQVIDKMALYGGMINDIKETTPAAINEVTSAISGGGGLAESVDATTGSIQRMLGTVSGSETGYGLTDWFNDMEDLNTQMSDFNARFIELEQQRFNAIGSVLTGTTDLYQGFMSQRLSQIDAEKQAEIDLVKSTVKGREEQKKQIAKIEKESEKERKKALMAQWVGAIASATTNTWLAVTDVLAREKSGAIGKGIAAATITGLGLSAVGNIIGSKPKFYNGSRNSSGNYTTVGGSSSGDTIPALLRSGETIVRAGKDSQIAQQALNGATTNNSSNITISPQFVMNGNVNSESVSFMESAKQQVTELIVSVIENKNTNNLFNPAYG